MKLIPILFSTPMVLALLANTKTQTRRIVKPQPVAEEWDSEERGDGLIEPVVHVDHGFTRSSYSLLDNLHKCPYGEVGDVLWVRETHKFISPRKDINGNRVDTEGAVQYKAGGQVAEFVQALDYNPTYNQFKPSIHMPYAACRIWLEIASIRIERLNDISTEDAIAEGISFQYPNYKDYISGRHDLLDTTTITGRYGKNVKAEVWSYGTLWESINGLDAWSDNPFVWVVSFRQVAKPVQ